MSTFSADNIYNHCDTAISIVKEQLIAVKSILAKHESEQQSLVAEKSSLEGIVSSLRLEKYHLEKQVGDLKLTLNNITNDVADTEEQHQHTMTHIFTTSAAASYDSSSDISEEDDSSEVIQISHHENFGDSAVEHDDPIFATIDCGDDSLVEKTGNQSEDDFPMLTQPPTEGAVVDSVVGLPGLQQHATQDGIATQKKFFSTDNVSIISAGSSTSSKRRRRISKVYDSPKKWRRMMRTRRLQSILLAN